MTITFDEKIYREILDDRFGKLEGASLWGQMRYIGTLAYVDEYHRNWDGLMIDKAWNEYFEDQPKIHWDNLPDEKKRLFIVALAQDHFTDDIDLATDDSGFYDRAGCGLYEQIDGLAKMALED